MKNKRGFTLVELLAVIVILGIILLIAVPKITSTINNASGASMEASAKMLAASAEREFTVQQTLGTTINTLPCTTAATLSATDYDLTGGGQGCKISIDTTTGVATVSIWGTSSGKFAGKCVLGATKLEAEVSTDCATAE